MLDQSLKPILNAIERRPPPTRPDAFDERIERLLSQHGVDTCVEM